MQKKQILDLQKYIDQEILVKFQGGRVVQGTLKGFDPLQNLVLDETVELIRDFDDEYKLLDKSRKLGLVVYFTFYLFLELEDLLSLRFIPLKDQNQ